MIHVLRLGLGNVRAVSTYAIVCKFCPNKPFKVTNKEGNFVLTSFPVTKVVLISLSLEDFRHLWKFSDVLGNLWICLCHLQKTRHSQDKNFTP